MKNRPLILVTNDDGVYSPGLAAAASVAAEMGDILIAAPHTQQTGMGRSFPRNEDTGIIDEVEIEINGKFMKAYAVHGSPSLSVAHGVMELSGRRPDLCISGINYGENLGTCLTCSGTLGAVFEANSYGIPGIAVSLSADFDTQRSNEFAENDWEASKAILRKYTQEFLEHGMPKGVDVWNINVPNGIKYPYPSRVTTQSRQNYYYFVHPPKRDYRSPFRLGSELTVEIESLEKDSDIYAIYVDHMISATPLNLQMSVAFH